jgi:hypothetical protein
MPDEGSVIELPLRRGGDRVTSTVPRVDDTPANVVDDWGRDATLVARAMSIADLRWDVTLGGDQHLPRRTGALLVVNARRWALTSLFTAFAVGRAIDRPVRFVGRDDAGVSGAVARRLGGLLDHPDEVHGALRAGELVVMSTTATSDARDVGRIDHTLVGAAVAASVRVHPVATISSPVVRTARVEIGAATHPPRRRRGPLVELELADRVGDDIRQLLQEMGELSRGTPLDWLPFGGLGGD